MADRLKGCTWLLAMALILVPLAAFAQAAADDLAAAKTLILAGHHEAAHEMLERRLATNPGDVEALFLLGMIALASEDYRAAVARFRQALERAPKATRIRLELARTLFLMKKDEEADYHFKLAIAQHPPEAVVENIARYREAIRARRSWRFNLNFGIAPDSNINSAPDKKQVEILGLPFQLDPDARARSGTGIVLGGDANVLLGRDSKIPIYMAAYGNMVRYSEHRFDDIHGGGEVGPQLLLSGGRLRVTATGLKRWYGGRGLVSSLGGRLNYDKVIGGKLGIEASLAARRNDYNYRSDVDGWDLEAGVAVNRELGASTLGLGYGIIQRGVANDPGQSYWSARLGLGAMKELHWGLRPQIAIEVARQVNDQPLLLFGKTRRDWYLRAIFNIYKRDWNIAGFAPSLRVTYTRSSSTITLYDQERLRTEFGITKAF